MAGAYVYLDFQPISICLLLRLILLFVFLPFDGLRDFAPTDPHLVTQTAYTGLDAPGVGVMALWMGAIWCKARIFRSSSATLNPTPLCRETRGQN